jgi:hypothetical protein
MCRPHWFSLPEPIRDEVLASARAYHPRALDGLEPMEIARRSMRYMAAVRAARELTVDAAPLTTAQQAEQAEFRSRDRHVPAQRPEPAAPATLGMVEAFLRRTGLSASTFGRQALRDSRIVFDMRRGRAISDRVQRRLKHFMAAVEAGERAL